MAFKRETVGAEFQEFLQDKIYDDVSLAKFIKSKGGRMCFNGRATCYNPYDERDFFGWSSRLAMIVRKFTPGVAAVYFGVVVALAGCAVLGVALASPLAAVPFAMWWLKGFIISVRLKSPSAVVPAASLLAVFVIAAILVGTLRKRQVSWRGKTYPI